MPTTHLMQVFQKNLVNHSRAKFAEQGATLHRSSMPERGPLYLKQSGKIHRTGITMRDLARWAGVDLTSIPTVWLD